MSYAVLRQLLFTIKIVVFPMWRLIYHSLIFPEAFNLYDIDKNGFITMKKMTDIIDAISSMVENTKMKICQRRESGRGFSQMEIVQLLSKLISSPELKANGELII